jgi:hypothetical protein
MDHIAPTIDCTLQMMDGEATARAVPKVQIEAMCRNYLESGIGLVSDSFPMAK